MEYTCKCISDDVELGGRSRVGIFKEYDNYSIITPYGLLLPNVISGTDRDSVLLLKKYAKCITKALSKQKVRQTLYTNITSKNNPLSALNVVLDYVQNGPYREFENETIVRAVGKIDFKKTISKVTPTIVNGEALYTSFVVSRKKVSSQELVTIAQGNVINHVMENGGNGTGQPDLTFPQQFTQQDQHAPGQKPAAAAVQDGGHLAGKDRPQKNPGKEYHRGIPGSKGEHHPHRHNVGKAQLDAGDGNGSGNLSLHHEDGQGNGGKQGQPGQAACPFILWLRQVLIPLPRW